MLFTTLLFLQNWSPPRKTTHCITNVLDQVLDVYWAVIFGLTYHIPNNWLLLKIRQQDRAGCSIFPYFVLQLLKKLKIEGKKKRIFFSVWMTKLSDVWLKDNTNIQFKKPWSVHLPLKQEKKHIHNIPFSPSCILCLKIKQFIKSLNKRNIKLGTYIFGWKSKIIQIRTRNKNCGYLVLETNHRNLQ